MIPQFRKSQLGTLILIGKGGSGDVYKTNISVSPYIGSFLYKEYNDKSLRKLDTKQLREMIRLLSELNTTDAKKLLSICSWPLAIVIDDHSARPLGFVMQAAPDCFKHSNYVNKKLVEYKGFQHLFLDDLSFTDSTGCSPLIYAEREFILHRIASVFAELHKRHIVIGDISPNNILVAMHPDYKVYLIDADSMSLREKGIFADYQYQTANWQVNTLHPNEKSGTYASDCHKLGLLAIRLLLQDISAFEGKLPADASYALKSLIERSLKNSADIRPTISEWTHTLDGTSSTTFLANAFLAKGQAEVRQGNKQEALTAYDKALFLDSNLADVYLARADLKTALGDYTGAIADFDKHLQIRPDLNQTHYQAIRFYLKGLLQLRQGNKQEALNAFDKALVLDISFADAYFERAFLKSDLGDYIGAVADYDNLLLIRPNQQVVKGSASATSLAKAYLSRGHEERRQGNTKAALVSYDKALVLDTNLADAYWVRSLLKSDLGDFKGAIDDYDKHISLRPNYQILQRSASTGNLSNAFFLKGQEKLRLGNKQEALVAFDKALFLDPNRSDAYLARASVKHDLRDYKGAINDYDQVILLQPDQVETYNDRGCCKYNLGDYQGAYEDFTRRLSGNPIAVIFYNRASSSLKLGDTISALADTMSGYALDAKKLNDSSYQEIKNLLDRSTLFALLGAWMVSNWKRNAALRKAATWQSGMPHTPIPPATNLSVASCIALISARMSTNWKENAVPRDLILSLSNLILAHKVRKVAGILVITSLGLAGIGRVEEHFKYERERSHLGELQRLLDAGNYRECIDKAVGRPFELRDEFQSLAEDLHSSCINKQAAATDSLVRLKKKEQTIKACGLEGSWSIAARIEDSELREKILSLIKSNYCSDSYLDGSIIIASRNHAEQTAIDLASSLNRHIQEKEPGVDAGFVAQSRLFTPLLNPFPCVVKTSSVNSQNTNTYKCSARFHIMGGYQTPGVEMIFQTADGNGLNFNWSPSESGSTSSGGTSITCNERDMAVQSTNNIGITNRIELPFQFLPCRSVSLNGICAMQERYNESNVYMLFGGCRIERIENGRTGIDVVLDTGLRMRFSTSESNSRNRQMVSFYQRPSDIFPRTESFPWSQRQEGIYIDLGGKALLIGGIKI